ncbi:phosphatidylinositol N-acetylglucosaminyltransferase subunit C-like [Argiope bruennichi]|uniref:phosphatidylinositol N-acetylglucosaminyltransferase subunit C-like n=1 Tax=Argiope bruennichi TaxID=94029 RepID=UPI00249420FC|nr:phosphatidylinositol N-acetylglucosaminyltransferase subunit C-like [Argiope bruennichi]
MIAMAEKWEKVLYKKQNFPDNYVDASFLSDLRKNVNLHKYTFWEAFTGISVVTHEISSTVLFVITYICMKENMFSIRTVVSGIAVLLIFCAFLQQWLKNEWWLFKKANVYEHVKSCIIFLTFGYMFSPILKTLTQSVSTDTVYAMVVLMLLLHVLCQDYGTRAAIVSSSVSLNSALFAAVCLASRLPTVEHTFALVVLAVIFFVLLPLIRKKIKDNIYCLLSMTGLFMGIVSIFLIFISVVYAILFMLLCFCINLFFIALFIYCQKYKENIFGPWDEAVVKFQ